MSDEHSINANLPILVTEEGIYICVNLEQLSKAESPIEVTEDGFSNNTILNEWHQSNAFEMWMSKW